LSEWQKIQFYEKVSALNKIDVPDLSYGLDHASLDDKLFLIDLIGRKDLQIYFVKLLNMLKTSPWQIQKVIIQTLVRFGRQESIATLQKFTKRLKSKESKAWVSQSIRLIKQQQGSPKLGSRIPQLRNAS
jgi:hypothetical protein